jgi:hypothetical protein
MKRTFVREVLQPVSLGQVDSQLKEKLQDTVYLALIKLIADCMDLRAAGEDVWINIGTDQSKTSLLLTVHDNGTRYTAGGATLADLAADCTRLL